MGTSSDKPVYGMIDKSYIDENKDDSLRVYAEASSYYVTATLASSANFIIYVFNKVGEDGAGTKYTFNYAYFKHSELESSIIKPVINAMNFPSNSGDEYKNLGATNGNNLIIVDSTTDTDSASVWVAHFDSLLYLSNFNINASNETSNLN